MDKNQITKLTLVLGSAALTGAVSLAALTGLFRIENAPLISLTLMAGPGAITTAIFSDGQLKERIFTAFVAGIIATLVVAFAAGFGPQILKFANIDILKLFGGLAVFAIGILIMGIKIPEKIPIIIMMLGFIISLAWR